MSERGLAYAELEAPGEAMGAPRAATPRLDLEPDNIRQGLGRLVLTLVRLLHELLERQALRRMEGGGLSEEQVERLGLTLMRQSEEIERVARELGLDPAELNLDLGPIGRLL